MRVEYLQGEQSVLQGLDFGTARQKVKRLSSDLLVSFRVYTILYVLVVAYMAGTFLVERRLGGSIDLDPMVVLEVLFMFILPLVLLGVVSCVLYMSYYMTGRKAA